MNRSWSSSTTVLNRVPGFVIATPECSEVRQRIWWTPSISKVCRYEAIIYRYGNHPFFAARVAEGLFNYRGYRVAERMFREVKKDLEELGIEDAILDRTIKQCSDEAAKHAKESLEASSHLKYTRIWRSSQGHEFPQDLHPPDGHEEVRSLWAELLSQDEDYRRKYSIQHAIDTNHVDGTFLLTQHSVDDVVSRGVEDYRIMPGGHGCTPIRRIYWIGDLIRETASGCDILFELMNEQKKLTRKKICGVRAKIMETYRFSYREYVPPGETRTSTQQAAVVGGRDFTAQCCPYTNVDEELDFICRKTKEFMQILPHNPFAIASWLHLVLTQCHPFDGGNGRVIRMIASVPLVVAGYPMINIGLDQRAEYYEGIRQAYEGDHVPMIRCFIDSMRKTLESIQKLNPPLHPKKSIQPP